ncbi:histidine phosphatase family protein [Halioxenophilus sp. WMMB6]|uniref:histidine phosphatase family protein n=1 Tax=Halioxenophilus sp. WMMB6 TaxID=3073815 RepID=UPI00295E4485|nr:histidine phosphatase family protein [Halioxenophilus sp. WMMB6]
MAEITLVRHGQASFGADNYDQLSALGRQQSRWLGEHLQALDYRFDQVVVGSLERHRDTANEIAPALAGQHEIQSGLNEYYFRNLLAALQQQYPREWTDTGIPKKDYYHNIRRALGYWITGEIESDGFDSWEQFCSRIREAWQTILSSPAKRILVVSSAGPISVILGETLQLKPEQMLALTLQIKNTSVCKILFNRSESNLDSFNDIAHLQHPDRQASVSFS